MGNFASFEKRKHYINAERESSREGGEREAYVRGEQVMRTVKYAFGEGFREPDMEGDDEEKTKQ